jgi:prepilin-type N-terminal cleavage/methylation domain-containing protein
MRRISERGYNLIEIVVAMAILAMVLLSVVTLFFLARRNVYSGQQRSRANAIAVRVLEDFSYLTADEVLTNLALDDNLPAPAGTCACTDIYNTDSGAPAFVNNWDTLVDTSQFLNGRVGVRITPIGGVSPNHYTTANFLRIAVIVRWNEELRTRQIIVSTAKPRR